MPKPEPETSFAVLMMQAAQAHARRQWATLHDLLRQARRARDAPPWHEARPEVAAWEDLMGAIATHKVQAHALIRAAIRLLLRRMQDRCGAAGAPDPTVQDFCDWLRTDSETLEMDLVDELAEDQWHGADISPQFLRTNPERDHLWYWQRMGEDGRDGDGEPSGD
jgi:hypothetical protein